MSIMTHHMAVAVFTNYRPRVDEYATVTVHAAMLGRTRCGRDVISFKRAEFVNKPIDCVRCRKFIERKP